MNNTQTKLPAYLIALLLIVIPSVIIGRLTAPKSLPDDNKWSRELKAIKTKDSVLVEDIRCLKRRSDSLESTRAADASKIAALSEQLAKAKNQRKTAELDVFKLKDSALVATFSREIDRLKVGQ